MDTFLDKFLHTDVYRIQSYTTCVRVRFWPTLYVWGTVRGITLANPM